MEINIMFNDLLQSINNLAEPNRAELAMCVFTAISVCFTVIVLNKQVAISKIQSEIMEQQNKIALYQERYKVYLNIAKLLSLKEDLQRIASSDNLDNKIDDIFNALLTQFAIQNPYAPTKQIIFLHVIQQEISAGEFLFSNRDEILYFSQFTLDFFRELTTKKTFTSTDLETFKQVLEVMENFSTNGFCTIKRELQI